MPPVGFEPTVLVGERRQQTYALDRAATGTCTKLEYRSFCCFRLHEDNFALKVPAFVSFRFSLENCSESESKSKGYWWNSSGVGKQHY